MTRAVALRVTWWCVLLGFVAATAGAAAFGVWEMRGKNQHVAPAANQAGDRQAVTEAANTATVKILSYSYQTLDQDFDAASALLTGDFLAYYRNFTNQTVKAAATQKRLTAHASVLRAGVETLADRKATILVFVNQTTTTGEPPGQQPTTSASSVRVGLVRVNGAWLVDSFNPV